MVESFLTRITSPVTALARGTWEGTTKRASLNPFSESFRTTDKIKWGIGAVVVILAIVAAFYVLNQVMVMGASTKKAYRSVKRK